LTHKKWFIPILYLVFGIAIGAGAQYELGPILFPSQTEQQWRSRSSHQQIMALQEALRNLGTPKDANTLTQQIEQQTKIEALITQSRAAEYSFLTPFTSISSIAVTLVTGLLTALAGFWQGKKTISGVGKA